MSINYESAWKQLKTFVSDMEGYSRPYSSIGFKAVLLKMEELEKSLATEEPKDSDIPTELSSEKFHELIEKARKLKPTDSVKKIPQLVKEYPDLADAAEKFSVSDFTEAAKILNEHHLYTDIVNQFVDEKTNPDSIKVLISILFTLEIFLCSIHYRKDSISKANKELLFMI